MVKVSLEYRDGVLGPAPDGAPCRELGPKSLMLYALGKCSSLTFLSLAEKMRVRISDYRMEVSGGLSDDPPVSWSHFVAINTVFMLGLPDERDYKKVLSAVQKTHDKYCGVSLMMQRIAPVSVEVYINGRIQAFGETALEADPRP